MKTRRPPRRHAKSQRLEGRQGSERSQGVQVRPLAQFDRLTKRTAALAALAGAISGLLVFLAFPPADLGFLSFVGLVPLAVVFRTAGGKLMALASLVFGIFLFGGLMYWIKPLGLVAYVPLIVELTLWIVLALEIGRLLRDRLPEPYKIAAFPVALVAGEYLRARFPLGGFTWGDLGYTQHDNLFLLRLASYTGVWGLSLLIAAVNAALAEAVMVVRTSPRTAGAWLAGAVAALLFPALLPVSTPQGPPIKVAMIQGNVPENTSDIHSDDEIAVSNHIRLTKHVAKKDPDLVIWPESAYDRDPFLDTDLELPLLRTIRETNTPFLVGGVRASNPKAGKAQNVTYFFRPDGKLEDVYVKRHLVPFGEYVPARRLLTRLIPDLSQRVGRPFDFEPGSEATVFSLPQGKLASVICFESTYPDLVRSFVSNGARLLLVSTNNSSYGRTEQSAQHLAFSQLRAAEHRMWVAHTGLSGISAVVRPDGSVAQRTKLFESATLTPTLRFSTGRTFYARYGDWLPLGILGMLVVVAFLEVRRDWTGSPVQTSES